MAGICKCGNEPSDSINAGNFLSSLGLVSFSRKTLLHRVSKKVSKYDGEWTGDGSALGF